MSTGMIAVDVPGDASRSTARRSDRAALEDLVGGLARAFRGAVDDRR